MLWPENIVHIFMFEICFIKLSETFIAKSRVFFSHIFNAGGDERRGEYPPLVCKRIINHNYFRIGELPIKYPMRY